MTEFSAHETHNIPKFGLSSIEWSLTEWSKQFRISKINEIKDYFVTEIKERELISKRLSKCIASFDYFDKSLIVLSTTTGSISIASLATVIGAPVGSASASSNPAF